MSFKSLCLDTARVPSGNGIGDEDGLEIYLGLNSRFRLPSPLTSKMAAQIDPWTFDLSNPRKVTKSDLLQCIGTLKAECEIAKKKYGA